MTIYHAVYKIVYYNHRCFIKRNNIIIENKLFNFGKKNVPIDFKNILSV